MADLPFWLQQLIYQSPLFAVSVFGVVLGLVYVRRHPAPALLTLLGCAELLCVTFVQFALQSYLTAQLRAGDMQPAEYARWSSLIGLATASGRALGFALVVVAVFVGRGKTTGTGADTSKTAGW